MVLDLFLDYHSRLFFNQLTTSSTKKKKKTKRTCLKLHQEIVDKKLKRRWFKTTTILFKSPLTN